MRALPSLLAAVLGLAAALIIGCGGDRSNLVSADAAAEIKGRLASAKSAIAAGECDTAKTAVDGAYDQALELPGGVDRRLRARLNEGLRRLREVYGDACQGARAETPEPTTTTETVPAQTTTTETVPAETTTTPSASTPTPSTVEPPATTTPDTTPLPSDTDDAVEEEAPSP